ncbi:MAG: hypothetical protein LBO07_00205 [Coriobacteriales bacterium]|nr:hypothetical protein [Coriobacteriales bacterium]
MRFFAEHKKLLPLFGEQAVAYVATLLVVYVFVLVQGGVNSMASQPLDGLVLAALVTLAHCVALGKLMSIHFPVAQIDYLSYLGFSNWQIRLLACSVAVPVSLAGALFVFLALTGGLPFACRLGVFVTVLVMGELTCPISLWLRQRLRARRGARQRKKARRSSSAAAFQGPYRAFFQKDLRGLRTWSGIFSVALLVAFGFGIMLFARIGQSWQGFAICFFSALFF